MDPRNILAVEKTQYLKKTEGLETIYKMGEGEGFIYRGKISVNNNNFTILI